MFCGSLPRRRSNASTVLRSNKELDLSDRLEQGRTADNKKGYCPRRSERVKLGEELTEHAKFGDKVGISASGIVAFSDDADPATLPYGRLGGWSSQLIALFLLEEEVEQFLRASADGTADAKKPCSPAWWANTQRVLNAIGPDHPVFRISQSEPPRYPGPVTKEIEDLARTVLRDNGQCLFSDNGDIRHSMGCQRIGKNCEEERRKRASQLAEALLKLCGPPALQPVPAK